MILALVAADPVEIVRHLRVLEEFSCIECRDHYHRISPPIREAIRRDPRFQKDDNWRQSIGAKICDLIKDYEDDDRVAVHIL
jgi:hypothetical protein